MTQYVMEAQENYPADLLAIIADYDDTGTSDYFCFQTSQTFTGDNFDPVTRTFFYSACLSLTVDPPAPHTLWDGSVAIPSGDTVLTGAGWNFSTLTRHIDTGARVQYIAYDEAELVPTGIGGGDGTWRRYVDTLAFDQPQVRRIIDPRNQAVYQHTYGTNYPCGLYYFHPDDDYHQIISPVAYSQHMEIGGLTDDWLHVTRGAQGVGFDIMLIPRTRQAEEITADRLLEFATFTCPTEFTLAYFRQALAPDGVMWFFGANRSGTRAYQLWKFEEPTSAPYGGPTVGGGFTEMTPWTSDGPNTSPAPTYNLNGSFSRSGSFNRNLMYVVPDGDGERTILAIISKLMPADIIANSRNPLLMQWDCTYYDTINNTYDFHQAFVTGYMKADWTPTADISEAAYSVIDCQEVNKYLDYHTWDFSNGDATARDDLYKRRWFFFTVQKVVGGAWTYDANENHTVIVQYEFAYGSAPAVAQIYDEDLWFDAYSYTGLDHPMNACIGALSNIGDAFFEWGLWDRQTNAFFWGGNQGYDNFDTAMGLLDTAYATRNDSTLKSSYPLLRIAIEPDAVPRRRAMMRSFVGMRR